MVPGWNILLTLQPILCYPWPRTYLTQLPAFKARVVFLLKLLLFLALLLNFSILFLILSICSTKKQYIKKLTNKFSFISGNARSLSTYWKKVVFSFDSISRRQEVTQTCILNLVSIFINVDWFLIRKLDISKQNTNTLH